MEARWPGFQNSACAVPVLGSRGPGEPLKTRGCLRQGVGESSQPSPGPGRTSICGVFSRFLKGNLSSSLGCGARLLGTDTVYLTEKIVLQEVSHNYGLREGPCQLFLVTGLQGEVVFLLLFFFFFFSNLKASRLGAGTRSDYPVRGQKVPVSSFRCCRWLTAFGGMSPSARVEGESEILRSLVVFFHGFAVTINLFLLNKKNRCLGVCWKHCCLL